MTGPIVCLRSEVGDVCQRMRCEHLGAHVARPAQARATLKGSVTIPLVGYGHCVGMVRVWDNSVCVVLLSRKSHRVSTCCLVFARKPR